MTYQRGTIVQLHSDTIEAESYYGQMFREACVARRYVVLGVESQAFAFVLPGGETIARPRRWWVWRIGWPSSCTPMIAAEDNMIATGIFAVEVA